MPNYDPLFNIQGRTAIITGASAGLGVTFAKVLAERGVNVVLAARRVERLAEVEKTITDAGGTAMSVACDVGEPDQVTAMVRASVERFGRIDVLVNNAGVVVDGGPVREKLPHDLFEETIKINLLGTWYCCRDVGAHMLAGDKGGSIINIASVAGMAGAYEIPPAYQASKAAVINLTRNLAVSWADRGVRVNAIAPGWFWSEMTEDAFNNPVWHDRATGGTPMNKIGDPEELAGVLLLLASDASSYMTGQTLAVDGGLSATFGASPPSADLVELIAKGVPDGLSEPIGP